MGSIISTSKDVKKISYLSCEELALNTAPVSLLGITPFNGLLMLKKSTSQPSVFIELGVLSVTMALALVILLLKKLLVGFTVFPNAVKEGLELALKESPSPLILLSPSKVATPNCAITGKGAGRVVKPLTGISTVSPDLIPAYPSKVVIYFPGKFGSS